MLTTNDMSKVYDTVLSIPGMNETVKIDLRISRKNALLLNSVIERGLSANEDDKTANLLNGVTEDSLKELREIAQDCLQKAGLIELKEKLNSFGAAK